MFDLVVDTCGPLGRDVVVESAAGGVHGGIIVAIGWWPGARGVWVSKRDLPVTAKEIGIWREPFQPMLDADAAAEGLLADSVAGGDCAANLK